jgi:hypothetical protein
MKRMLSSLIVIAIAAGGFGLGRVTAGPTLPVIPLPSGSIGPDPTDRPSGSPSDTSNDGALRIDVAPDGTLVGAGETWAETTGRLLLEIRNGYDGYLLVAIERDRGAGQFEVVYEATFDRAASGEVAIDVVQAGSYRVSAIPGNPPLEASTATLTIVAAPTP